MPVFVLEWSKESWFVFIFAKQMNSVSINLYKVLLRAIDSICRLLMTSFI